MTDTSPQYLFETIFQERIAHHRARAEYHRSAGHSELWALRSEAKAAKWEAKMKEHVMSRREEILVDLFAPGIRSSITDDFLNGNGGSNRGLL